MLKPFKNNYAKRENLFLYAIWRFRWLSYDDLKFFNNKKIKLESIINYFLQQEYINEKNLLNKKYYFITKLGASIIKQTYYHNNRIAISKEVHNNTLYKLINYFSWTSYLSELEVIQQIGYKKIIKNNIPIPDLVIFQNGKSIAIEVERTIKSKNKYQNIWNDYNSCIRKYFNEVWYFAVDDVYKYLRKIKNKLNSENSNWDLEGAPTQTIKLLKNDAYNNIKIFKGMPWKIES